METGPIRNRKTRRTIEAKRGIHLLSKERKVELAEQTLVEQVKDNMAEKVIDNFVSSLTELPFAARLRFCIGILFHR